MREEYFIKYVRRCIWTLQSDIDCAPWRTVKKAAVPGPRYDGKLPEGIILKAPHW